MHHISKSQGSDCSLSLLKSHVTKNKQTSKPPRSLFHLTLAPIFLFQMVEEITATKVYLQNALMDRFQRGNMHTMSTI